MFKNTSYAITELLDDPIDAEEIDQFTKKFCIDHVKCVKVFPVNLVSFSTNATTGDDVEFQYFVRTTRKHSWLKWVTVKQSLLLKGGVNDGKMMG